MLEFKGFDDFIPIFRGGKQIDSSGREHDGGALIDRAVATFNAAAHEPPVVIGHPKDNSPAFGWVSELKKVGNELHARFKQVVPEFADMARRGLFKKRSAAFFPDGRLRHVGFLGAAPPAVKGLPDIAFNDDGSATFEFSETDDFKFSRIGDVLRNLREWMIGKFGQAEADKIVGNYEIEALSRPTTPARQPMPGFKEPSKQEITEMSITPQDLESAKRDAAEDARKKTEAEFNEKLAAMKKEKDDLAARIAREHEDRRKAGIREFVEAQKREGKFVPAWEKAGVVAFMESLDAGAAINFSEDRKQTPLEFFQAFLTGLPKIVEFRELAGDKAPSDAKSARDHLRDKTSFDPEQLEQHQRVLDFAEKNNCSYMEALERMEA